MGTAKRQIDERMVGLNPTKLRVQLDKKMAQKIKEIKFSRSIFRLIHFAHFTLFAVVNRLKMEAKPRLLHYFTAVAQPWPLGIWALVS